MGQVVQNCVGCCLEFATDEMGSSCRALSPAWHDQTLARLCLFLLVEMRGMARVEVLTSGCRVLGLEVTPCAGAGGCWGDDVHFTVHFLSISLSPRQRTEQKGSSLPPRDLVFKAEVEQIATVWAPQLWVGGTSGWLSLLDREMGWAWDSGLNCIQLADREA